VVIHFHFFEEMECSGRNGSKFKSQTHLFKPFYFLSYFGRI
jgi:hypothetical protein